MHTLPRRSLALACIGWTVSLCPLAQAVIITFDDVNLGIPDGSLSGLADTRTVDLPDLNIHSLSVTLSLSGVGAEGGFNGDLYATLTHGSGYVVLLNRPGVTPSSSFGYSDNGVSQLTFADNAAKGDVHDYRLTLTGSRTTPLSGPLTGLWQPDGRTRDPETVLGSDPRTTSLGSFKGEDAGGDWTLFLADLSSGGQLKLDSWALEISSVPEPSVSLSSAMLLIGAGIAAWAGKRQRG